jgi:hypothetical protein
LRVFDPLRTTLADLRYAAILGQLVESGESESVERKVTEPRAGFGPILSAFATRRAGGSCSE